MICSAAPTFFVLFSEQIKLLVFCKNRERVMKLNKYMYENFWNAKYNREETKIFNECNSCCIKALACFLVTMQCISVHLMLAPYLEPSDNSTSGEKIFPFPLYVNYPIFETPTYEILYVLEVLGLYGVVLCVMSFPIFLLVTNMFTAVQFKMLNLRMRSLCQFPINKNGDVNLPQQMNAYEKLKECIRKHQSLIHYVNEMENLYCYAMLGQILASIFQLSSTSITILLSNQGAESVNKAVLRMLILVASLLQFYFYAYSSHEILTESERISEAIYSSDWYQITHPRYRKNFSLLVQIVSARTQRPCILTVGKYCPLTLNTFTTLLCSAAPTFSSLSSELMKLFVFFKNRERVMQLNEYMYENFWNAKYNREETNIFNECNGWCIKALACFLVTMQCISVHLMLAPYLEFINEFNLKIKHPHILQEPSDNSTSGEKIFPFPLYVNYPIFESPVYEILFVLEVLGLYGVVLCVLSFPIFLLVTNMFTAVQFKMLNLQMQSLNELPKNKNGNVNLQVQEHAYEKIKDCILKHQLLIHYVDEIESLYSYAMMVQIFASILQLSSASITILLSNQGEESLNKAVLRISMLVASMMQVYFYAYSSHEILTESEKISEGIYSTGWYQITHPRYQKNFSLLMMCSVAPTFCSLSSELIKLLVFCKNRQRVMKLNKYMYENFWNAEYNKEETLLFNKCNNWCIKALICYLILLQIIVVHLTIAPYLEPRDNTTWREIELPFPIYIDYPIHETPVYEILFILEVFGLQGVILCLLAFPIFLLVTNMFMAVQFKMLSLRMRSLCKFPNNDNSDNVDIKLQMHTYEKLKDCIRKHQLLIHYVDEMENLYCYAMLGQIFASICQVSSTSITILLSNQGEESMNHAVARIEILAASTLQFYIYAYSSHAILTESEKISEGIYSSDWFRITHPSYQKHFSLLVQIVSVRAQRPCILTVGKYCPLTLITFQSRTKQSLTVYSFVPGNEDVDVVLHSFTPDDCIIHG
ncbi:hypothetical protein TSAR_000489 [Trichomalopsis sarcophagae]|uniref:Odorant receptor n=1 Tax=Trichomalopsis sarcophagae TaxID=543379 RepID=A0A232EQ22_9HYME|nr:hypothetical protein TSAR_000489 [Trichomalopsis sarcophagae]